MLTAAWQIAHECGAECREVNGCWLCQAARPCHDGWGTPGAERPAATVRWSGTAAAAMHAGCVGAVLCL